MAGIFPSLSATWRNDTYPAINPKRPELSLKGKTAVVTGSGQGIGAHIALGLAQAGAAHIALIGRTQRTLDETKARIEAESPGVRATAHVADVIDYAALQKAANEIGQWDIMVLNAGFMSTPGIIAEQDINDWWKTYEINIKGPWLTVKAFLPTHRPNAIALVTATEAINFPGSMSARYSSYGSSKIGVLKLWETLQAEVEDVNFISFHPGVIKTNMMAKSGMEGQIPIDKPELPAHFVVWLASEEAKFLHGRYISCNFDVDELKAREKEILDNGWLIGSVTGYPYPPAAKT